MQNGEFWLYGHFAVRAVMQNLMIQWTTFKDSYVQTPPHSSSNICNKLSTKCSSEGLYIVKRHLMAAKFRPLLCYYVLLARKDLSLSGVRFCELNLHFIKYLIWYMYMHKPYLGSVIPFCYKNIITWVVFHIFSTGVVNITTWSR